MMNYMMVWLEILVEFSSSTVVEPERPEVEMHSHSLLKIEKDNPTMSTYSWLFGHGLVGQLYQPDILLLNATFAINACELYLKILSFFRAKIQNLQTVIGTKN